MSLAINRLSVNQKNSEKMPTFDFLEPINVNKHDSNDYSIIYMVLELLSFNRLIKSLHLTFLSFTLAAAKC